MTNFLKGDMVTIERCVIPPNWTNNWMRDMTQYVGNGVAYPVHTVRYDGLYLEVGGPGSGDFYTYPTECCELAARNAILTSSSLSPPITAPVITTQPTVSEESDPHGLIAQRRALREFLGG